MRSLTDSEDFSSFRFQGQGFLLKVLVLGGKENPMPGVSLWDLAVKNAFGPISGVRMLISGLVHSRIQGCLIRG